MTILYNQQMHQIEKESSEKHKIEGKREHPDGSKDTNFVELNLKAIGWAQEKFASIQKKLNWYKAPDFENLSLGIDILNKVDSVKLRLDKKRFEEKKPNKIPRNKRNPNRDDGGDEEIGWKYETKSLKKLVAYHTFSQMPEGEEYKSYISDCKKIANKIDTPATLVKNIKNIAHLKKALLISNKSEQPFIYKKFIQAEEIIKEDLQLLNSYRFQFLTYIHYIRLFIVFVLEQQEKKWEISQSMKGDTNEQMNQKIDENGDNTGEMQEESFLNDHQQFKMEPKVKKIPSNEPIFLDEVNQDFDFKFSHEELNNIDNYTNNFTN